MKMPRFPRLILSLALAATLSGWAVGADEKVDAGSPPSPEELNAYAELTKRGVSAQPVAANINWRYVNFRGAQKPDAAVFALLKPCTLIVDLDLAGAPVNEADLANLAGLKNLKRLSLANSTVADSALVHLTGLTKLESLNLFHTAITDAGLTKLNGLKNLKRLYVAETKVTDAGVQAFQKAVANVQVDQGWKLPPPDAKPAKPATAVVPPAPKPEEKKATPPSAAKPAEPKAEEKKPTQPASPAPKLEDKKPAPVPPKP